MARSKNCLCLNDRTDLSLKYDNYIWIDEGCVEGIKWCENNDVKYRVISGYWITNDDILKSSVYLKHIKRQVLEYTKDLLNDYQETNFTISEWNIMLSFWMDAYITQFYDKYIRLKQIEKMGIECECELFDIEEYSVPLDYTEYLRLAQKSEKFHEYQYSQLISVMEPARCIKVIKYKQYFQDIIEPPRKTFGYYKTDVYKFLFGVYKGLTHSHDKVVLQESYLPNKFLVEAMKKKPGAISNYIIDYHRHEKVKLNRHIDLEWRKKNNIFPKENDEFLHIVISLLKRNLPIAYVEDFKYLQKRVKILYKYALEPNAVIYACGGVSYDEIFKTYLMSIRHTKAKFYDVQHGGNYGIDKEHLIPNETEISDYMYTWGWKITENFPCECRPMPAAKLIDDRLQHVKMGDDILYISYTSYKHICDLSRENIFYKEEMDSEIDFLKSLSNSLKSQMVVRLFPNEFGWNVRKNIENNVIGMRFDEEPDYYKSLNRAKCVVLMRWSTTILEALYTDKPIIVLRKDGFVEPNAESDLKKLEDVGVLVKDWKALRKRLEDVYNNIDDWWNEPKRKNVIKEIKNKYIYMPENAKEIWINELLRLTNDGE